MASKSHSNTSLNSPSHPQREKRTSGGANTHSESCYFKRKHRRKIEELERDEREGVL